jgi:hypothetical protein
MYRPARARPTSTRLSSSGRTKGFMAWCIGTRLSITSLRMAALKGLRAAGSIIGMAGLRSVEGR